MTHADDNGLDGSAELRPAEQPGTTAPEGTPIRATALSGPKELQMIAATYASDFP